MNLRSVKFIGDLKDKTVLVRVDFNIVLDVEPDEEKFFRLKAALPTLQFLRQKGAELILLTHLGRPKASLAVAGRPKKRESKLSTIHLLPILEKLLKEKIGFFDDPKKFEKSRHRDTHIYLFENLRFFPGEEANDMKFAIQLATLGEMYVNEAFSASHRAHASVVALARLLPAYAGFTLEKEVEELRKVLHHAQKPLVVLLGGAKVDTKAKVIKQFVDQAEAILLAGTLPNPFMVLAKKNIGQAKISQEELAVARKLLKFKNIIFPTDAVVTKNIKSALVKIKNIDEINNQDLMVDIGPQTIRQFAIILKKAKTIIWNGPPGLFEKKPFSRGTLALAEVIASRARGQTYAVVGGGETVTALYQAGVADSIDHLSTGGGAMLEFLGGQELPGLTPLKIDEE